MRVSVHALFSHNDMIGSRIISAGTAHLTKIRPAPSHIALLVNNRWVHESTGSGVHVSSYNVWSQQHHELARVEVGTNWNYQDVADKFREIQGKKYDYIGVLYLGLAIIPTFLGFSLPKKNLWEHKSKYFCCEAVGYMTGHYYGMSSPVQILEQLKDTKNG